jgi:class 3 adenylate cyclase
VTAVPVRTTVWILHVGLPLLGLWLLIQRPAADVMWENHTAHFWLVMITAAVSVFVAVLMNREAGRRGDARLFLVSLGFATSAGFLALHALATPGLLFDKNTGFVVATPVGLLITSLFAAASALSFTPEGSARVIASRPVLRGLVAVALGVWLIASLVKAPPLARPISPEEVHSRLLAAMSVGAAFYLYAAARYALVYRRRPSVMLISVITAFVLLGEAMVSAAYGRNWHASWWEWHILMALGFAFVAYSAVVQWGREGSPHSLFGGIALERTLRSIQEEYGAALEALVAAMESGDPADAAAARVADRFELTERQRDVLVRSAAALASERDQIRRQGALVAIGNEASVIRDEEQFLSRVVKVAASSFAGDEVRIALDERLAPSEVVEARDGSRRRLMLPLTVKGKPAGAVEIVREREFAERDRALFASFASQLSIALENTRLYRQLDGLFHSYLSPDVATSLLADPAQASLGGAVVDVTVMMADLGGFTPFSERTAPPDVVAMLNTYFGLVVPVILDEGGTVSQFIGDAIMAIFNAPVRQTDHALRAARAALRALQVTDAAAQAGWPRFRIGINTGPALVGNIGAEQMRQYTAIGDAVNLAARLEASGTIGQVVVSGTTLALLGAAAEVESLGELQLKGKAEPVPAYRLLRLRDEAASS